MKPSRASQPTAESQNLWLVIIAVILAVGAAWLVMKQRRRRQNERLTRLREERDRNSRDLHDGMGEGFSSIGFQLEAIEESLTKAPQSTETIRALLTRARTILDRSQAAARQAMWDLRELLEHSPDLGFALQSMVRTQMMGRYSPKVEVKAGTLAGQRNLFAEKELVLVAQEALSNALRHAQAKTITLEVERDSDSIHFTIKDDGIGMAGARQSLAEGHLGILGMNERIRRINGSFVITSQPGQGTEIAVIVPTGKPSSGAASLV